MFKPTKIISQEGTVVRTLSMDKEVLDEQSFATEEEAKAAFWAEFHAINDDPELRIEYFAEVQAMVSGRE